MEDGHRGVVLDRYAPSNFDDQREELRMMARSAGGSKGQVVDVVETMGGLLRSSL